MELEHGNKGKSLATDTDVSDTIFFIHLCFDFLPSVCYNARAVGNVEHPGILYPPVNISSAMVLFGLVNIRCLFRFSNFITSL